VKSELFAVLMLLAGTAACSGKHEHKDKAEPPPGPATVLVPTDGGMEAVTVPPGVDPTAVHVDDVGPYRPVQPPTGPARERRPIDVTLRSSPPGAVVSVDGNPLGNTPAFWNGYADGREHTFVFTLPGHALARYRFVPVSSGVLHARLEAILEEHDAGVGPPPEVVPHPPPSAVVPPSQGPVITPDAAVEVPTPQTPPGIPPITPPATPVDAAAPATTVPSVGPQP
jgi:hypothetical protein